MNKEIYRKYFKKNRKGVMLLILTIGIGTVVSGINPYIYGKIVDSISEKNTFFLKKWLLLLGIVLIATLILEIVESMLGNWLTNTTENQIKSELLERIVSIKCYKLDVYEEGELFNKIEFDAENIVSYYVECMTSILMIVFNLGISVYFILNISKNLALITFITMPILYSVNIIFRKKVYLVNHRIRKFTDKYYSFLEGTLSEVIPIKIFCLESDMAQRYKEYLNEKLRLILKSVDIKKINKTGYYQKIGCVFQDYTKFEDSIRNNIRFGNIKTDNTKSIENMLEITHMKERVDEIGGLDTIVGKWFGKEDLSIGEWQRISICRAAFKQII